MRETFFRLAASGFVPRSLFAPELPEAPPPLPVGRPLELEIVSHCWQYAHLLTYQLSSLVLHPPAKTSVTMTVFYAPEDESTAALLEFFGSKEVPRVRWNWQPLEKTKLFRRSLGRNLAARVTKADWIWFCDCDVVFHRGALDGAGEVLRRRTERLVFPREIVVTDPMDPEHPVLQATRHGPRLMDIERDRRSYPVLKDRAIGAFQIVRGDVARAAGYCGTIGFYQRPLSRWRRTHDDRVFRWLLGTPGTPVDIHNIYLIRHVSKGRNTG